MGAHRLDLAQGQRGKGGAWANPTVIVLSLTEADLMAVVARKGAERPSMRDWMAAL